ncbi:MAG: rhomboid family intramembrane serine protease [Verrucomicrobiota bacterium]
MGWSERQYQEPQKQSFFGRQMEGAPVVKWLLILNLAVFVLERMTRPEVPRGVVRVDEFQSQFFLWGVYSTELGLLGGQVWRLITFQFLHANFMHFFFNLYAIFMFGPIVERWWGSRPFVAFYLLSGVGGALFYTLLWAVPGLLPDSFVGQRLLGASAGVFGILVGAAMIAPRGIIRLLFPPIPMTMKTFALVFLAIEVFIVITNQANAGGSAGHLGGALLGFLMFRVTPVKEWLLRLEQGRVTVQKPKRRRRNYEAKMKPATKVRPSTGSGEIDRILDKINEEGLQSLTEEERQILQKASKR